jgi:thiaminase (transcriptional activator TenA)
MAFTDELYAAARPIWDRQLQHPFVRGIATGALDEDRFRRWVRQDYRYLVEFARVFAWAAAKADRLEAMTRFASSLSLTLDTEMALHREYASRFGITADELEREPMWPTTQAYTDFLVRTAAAGDLAELIAALLPCSWGYVHLGEQLAREPRPTDQRYADWIDQYSAPEFAQDAQWLRGELNRLVEDATAEKRQRLAELFVTSSRYEWQFWEMCWNGEQWRP